jgi:hypothetical protein
MIAITVTPKTKSVLVEIPGLTKKFHGGIKDALHEIGPEILRETKRLIETGKKTGRTYRVAGMNHQASAPTESPAGRTGRLADSGEFKVKAHIQMEIGETADYAKFLEDGTRKMDPRQHLIRAVNGKARETENALYGHVGRHLGL